MSHPLTLACGAITALVLVGTPSSAEARCGTAAHVEVSRVDTLNPAAERWARWAQAHLSGQARAPDHLAAGELPRAERVLRFMTAVVQRAPRAPDHLAAGDLEALGMSLEDFSPLLAVASPHAPNADAVEVFEVVSRVAGRTAGLVGVAVTELLRSPSLDTGEAEAIEVLHREHRERVARERERAVREAPRTDDPGSGLDPGERYA